MDLKGIRQKIAASMILNNIVGFNFENPITFKSGILSPMYCDLRKAIAYPMLTDLITRGLVLLLHEQKIAFDVVLGVATGGVPHAAFLAKELRKPMAYTRQNAKDHGTKRLTEGADLSGQKVLVVEDLVTMATSIMEGIGLANKEGALATVPVSIFSYDFKKSHDEFNSVGKTLKSLVTIHDLLPMISAKLTQEEFEDLKSWIADPYGWRR